MKKLFIATAVWAIAAVLTACGGADGNDPGRAYMPDMYYSRAYETYGYNNIDDYQKLKERGINYNATPVRGTVARGDMAAFNLPANDSGYQLAATYPNPMRAVQLSPTQMKEAERIYLVNCGICHGTKLDGNGPLWKGGDGPFPAAPRNLLDDYTKKLSDGQIFHAITYGKGQMGSYASQVHPEQRWWLVNYLRNKQGVSGGAETLTDSTAANSNPGATQPATGNSPAPTNASK